MIDLYTASTPNGWKASVTLEELGIPCTVHPVRLAEGGQKKPDFLRICPNGRIPAIVDRAKRERRFPGVRVRRDYAVSRETGGEAAARGPARRIACHAVGDVPDGRYRTHDGTGENLKAWMERLEARPTCQRGIVVPEPLVLDENTQKAAQTIVTR